MTFEFSIPLSLTDLLKSGGVNQYVVREVLSKSECAADINVLKLAFRTKGPLAFLEHFDAPYSVLYNFRTVDAELKEETLELLVTGILRLSRDLPSILDSVTLSATERKEYLNTVKMTCYLLTQLTEAFEAEYYKSSLANLAPSGKGKKGKSTSSLFDWEVEREKALQALIQLLQLDIRRLWNMTVVEEEFVSILTCCCYKILENSSIGHVKCRPTRDAVAHLLGIMVKRYNHMLGARLKITQLLQHFEHLAPVFVHAVSLWATEYGMKAIVGEIMREIGQKSPDELAKESSGVKAYAAFLAELSEKIPGIMLPSMSVLLDHVDGESYTMRNTILSMMGEMVVQVLKGDDLEESVKDTRDEFLETLKLHLHDVHSFVRSKVLQIFTRIVQERALPLACFQSVVTLTVERLLDKSANACKNAIQLLMAFLANNPFSWKLSSEDLNGLLQTETANLREMKEKQKPAPPALVIEAWEEWDAMVPELLSTVKTMLQGQSEEEDEETEQKEELDEEETAENVSQDIVKLLKQASYKKAVQRALAALQKFGRVPPFGIEQVDVGSEDVTEENLMSVLALIFKGEPDIKVKIEEPAPEEPNNAEQPEEGTEHASAEIPTCQAQEEEDSKKDELSDLAKKEMLVQYLKDAYAFTVKIEDAITLISEMLYQNSISVVQEAIEFFVMVTEFGMAQAVVGVRKMLPLVWSKEPGVKEAVIDAYRRLYLSPKKDTQKSSALTLVQNLSTVMINASLGTIQCLEEIIYEFVKADEIKPPVIQVLWEQFTGKSPCSVLERRAAVILLGMVARAEPEVVGSNLETLVNVGLGEKVHEDYQLACDVCSTISKISDSEKPKLGNSGAPFRLPKDHLLFTSLRSAITEGYAKHHNYYLPFTDRAIALIYQLAENPDEICTDILRHCYVQFQEEVMQEKNEIEPPAVNSEDKQTLSSADNSNAGKLPTYLLSHLFSLVGSVALQQVVHLENAVSAELRRRRMIREEQEAKKDARNKHRKSKDNNESGLDEEMGLVGASAEDTEAELVRKICETELLNAQNLLSVFVPMVLKVCNNPGKYKDSDLTTIASFTLAKLLMISTDFCESHLRLLFTILEKSPLPTERSNLIIALGDLAIRFPNLIEPWTANLYARLRDSSPSVRLSAGLVLNYLILKDMVKVKGQISEMAVLIIDPDQEVAGLARNFFNMLSKKGNTVYNLVPDIISRLSDPDCGVDEEAFQTILRELLSYITKDKQTESLVEKLCQRFRTARSERQWRDLAYCLSLLPFTDRCIRKMQENFECFGDKLTEEAVYQSFMTVVSKLRRGAKQDVKVMIDEFEQKITICHNKGLDMDELEQTTMSAKKEPKAGGKKDQTANRRHKSLTNGDESDYITPKPRTRRNVRSAKKKAVVVFTSDEEEDESEAEVDEDETPKVTTPILRSSRRTRAR